MIVVTVARRPLTGTVAANVLEHGTGGINVDACRTLVGRWPANLILDPVPAAALDEEVGSQPACSPRWGAAGTHSLGREVLRGGGSGGSGSYGTLTYGDEGGPSRYFRVVR